MTPATIATDQRGLALLAVAPVRVTIPRACDNAMTPATIATDQRGFALLAVAPVRVTNP